MDYEVTTRLLAALERHGVRYVIFGAVALNLHGDLLGPYPAIQYVPPDGAFHVDILTRLGEAFAFDDLEVERVPFDALTVTVVTPRMLYRMKKDTVRLKDRADAEMLNQRFKLEPA